MPKYERPFTVWALRIAEILPPAGFEGSMLIPADPERSPFPVTNDFIAKYKPEPGGYYILYANGYQTYMTAEQFEATYRLSQP
jgi:hypothetical protein